jgi:Zn finger protein HypA/HybF involved in hydrogenase expression
MENNNISEENRKVITILNFECKNCHTKAGQLISNNIDENKVVCPECGSDNVSYGTLLK